MAKKKKHDDHGGGHGWFVTFADLMALLMSFFVMLAASSSQDKKKMQVVAGSMREAFGVDKESRRDGMVEIPGIPVKDYLKQVGAIASKEQSGFAQERHDQKEKQGPEANTHDIAATTVEKPRQFALAAASLRQSWQEMPEIAEASDNIMIEETVDGLAIQLVDQEGRAMFPEGSKFPYERTRFLISRLGPVLRKMPNKVQISGHTTANRLTGRAGYSNWELSADRANAIRQILTESGLPYERIHSVMGKADTDPLFPNDAYLAANARVTILLMPDAPPLPTELKK